MRAAMQPHVDAGSVRHSNSNREIMFESVLLRQATKLEEGERKGTREKKKNRMSCIASRIHVQLVSQALSATMPHLVQSSLRFPLSLRFLFSLLPFSFLSHLSTLFFLVSSLL